MKNPADRWQKAAIPVLLAENTSDISALYWIGSLAHGGFSERFSDVDVAVIFRALPAEAQAKTRIDQWKRKLPEGERWSVFWCDPALNGGRMPVPDRIDLLDHGRLFHGAPFPPQPRPEREELRAYLRDVSIPYWTELARAALPDDEKTLVRLALYPARFAYSWETGRIGSNETAVGYVRAGKSWAVDSALLKAGLEARATGRVDRELFDLRKIRKQLEDVFSSL